MERGRRPKWQGVFEIWEGGLGIWGGIAGGAIAAAIVVRRSGESVWAFFDAGAPGVLLAQAIGRWGNYFNQELFGKPTDLPWGLEIDTINASRPAYSARTFHPLFLYESIWCLLGVGVLLLVDRRFTIKPPGIFCLYVAWYTAGRLCFEFLRVDHAHELFGIRLNAYVAAALLILSIVGFVWSQRRTGEPQAAAAAQEGSGAEAAARRWPSPRAASVPAVSIAPMPPGSSFATFRSTLMPSRARSTCS